MRLIFIGLCGAAFTGAAIPAKADVLSYCEAYARNQADMHLSGSAVLGSQPKLAAIEQEKRKMLALADCLTLYAPKPVIEAVKEQPEFQPEPVIARAKLEPQPDEPETVTAIPIVTPRAKPKTMVLAEQKTPAKPAAKIEAATAIAPPQKKKPVADAASLVARSPAWKAYCAAKYTAYNPSTDTYTARSGEQRRCRVTKNPAPKQVTKRELPVPAAKGKLPTRAAKSQPLPNATVWDSFDNPGLPISR